MRCLPQNAAQRRYLFRFIPAMALYIVFLFIAEWAFRHLHPAGTAAYLLAILPALPLVGTLAVVGLYLAEEPDEFERSIIVQSLLWGIAGALSLSTVWGLLEDFTPAPHISTFYVYVAFWIVAGISQPLIRMRYR